jgi:hypothetical protein
MSTHADEDASNPDDGGDGEDNHKKRKKARHYRTPVCSFTSGFSLLSGGGDGKVR